MSTGKKVKASLIPVWQLECCMCLLTDVLQGPTSPTWNINSPLKKQNQVPQSKSSLLKSIKEFPFCFCFSDVYTPNRSLTVHVLYLIQWISCANAVFLSFVKPDSPCSIKVFAILNENLPNGCWLLFIIWMVKICFDWSDDNSSNWAWERSQCSQHLLVVILIKLPYSIFSSALQKREQFPEGC